MIDTNFIFLAAISTFTISVSIRFFYQIEFSHKKKNKVKVMLLRLINRLYLLAFAAIRAMVIPY